MPFWFEVGLACWNVVANLFYVTGILFSGTCKRLLDRGGDDPPATIAPPDDIQAPTELYGFDLQSDFGGDAGHRRAVVLSPFRQSRRGLLDLPELLPDLLLCFEVHCPDHHRGNCLSPRVSSLLRDSPSHHKMSKRMFTHQWSDCLKARDKLRILVLKEWGFSFPFLFWYFAPKFRKYISYADFGL